MLNKPVKSWLNDFDDMKLLVAPIHVALFH